jgi:transcriptional regulator with XRE-family HTH domain
MTDVRIGRFLATVRRHLGLRQADVATLAGLDQTVVSRLERGLISGVSITSLRRVCAALGIEPSIELRWRGGLADRLIDQDHARLVEVALRILAKAGWTTVPEYSFSVYGERGSVDILAWHPVHRALLIVEVKTRLTDLQALLMAMSRKVRLVPGLVADERGWDRSVLGRVVLVADTRANRTIVDGHRSMFDATFPARSREVRRWLGQPTGDLPGLWLTALRRDTPTDRDNRQRVRHRHARGARPNAVA